MKEEKPKKPTPQEIEDNLKAQISIKFLQEFEALCRRYNRTIAFRAPILNPEVLEVHFPPEPEVNKENHGK